MRALRSLAALALAAAGLLQSSLAAAQSSPAAQTSYTRYDALGRVVGTIAPDPDGTGPLPFPATRSTYDAQGNLTKAESGSLSTWPGDTAPASWSSFAVTSSVTYS